jgi:hypothetical protein
MPREIANKDDMKAHLKKLGDLYEGGKDIVNRYFGEMTHDDYNNLMLTFQQMRDMCAVQLQEKHWIDPN